MDSASLMHLGDVRLTMALGGAVTVWLVIARAYKTALWWGIAVAATFGVVATSKIVYLAWGLQSTFFDFKAASGHAAGAAAALPVSLHLIAGSHRRGLQNSAFLAGALISGAVAFLLVHHGEHTVSEAIAGWCIGASASISTWIKLRGMRLHHSPEAASAAFMFTIVIATCVQTMPVGWWLVRTALMLSGAAHLHRWEDC